MSRPNGAADERFDEAGFEVPFAASFGGEALSGSEPTFEGENEAEVALSESEGDNRDVALGTLRHTSKSGKTFTYKFTKDDLLWTARYLMGEAGDDVERTAVLWTMVNRFAFYRALGRGWRTFAALLRAYSSPLQYPLNSVGAAYRHWKKCPGATCRFVDLSAEFGYYEKTMNGQRVPKGQLRPFIALQKTGWNRLNESVRRVAANVLSGAAPSNVGLATEFADTAVFWRDHHRGAKGPTRTQWLEYTKAYAAHKNYIWASDTAPYDQYRRNVLFIQARFRDETVPVVVASQASQSATTPQKFETSYAAVERESESVAEAAPVSEMESRSRAAKLELFPAWQNLLLMKVDDGIQKALAKRQMRVQYAHNESYSNDLNFDLYPIRINRFPTIGGTVMTPERFVKHVRLNLNSFLDTSISRFYPYSIPEAVIWPLDKPVGIVLKIDIPLKRVLNIDLPGDNAAVVVSSASPTGWVFSTVTTPGTGTHPVSGHRKFFLAQRDGTYYFINKGLDMTSSGIAGLGLPLAGSFGYGRADTLWRSLQTKLTTFINANGGEAKRKARISERVEWRYVYHRYRQALEQVFGKGAGSSRNSPFFDITDESTETTSDQAAV